MKSKNYPTLRSITAILIARFILLLLHRLKNINNKANLLGDYTHTNKSNISYK